MQRKHRPVPIVVPEETTPHDFKLTDSGVFETGGIVVSKAGCIITKNDEPSARSQSSSGPASVCPHSSRPVSCASSTPEPPASSQSASGAAADADIHQRPASSSRTAAAAACPTPADSSAADSSSTGSQVAVALDDLEELSVIGSGSSGVVKKVLHRPTGGVYVLKVINFDMGSEQVRRQVTTEVKALDGARHPHIVSYHQSYFTNGALTILMELMDGGSLWDLLQKIRVVPQQYLPELARQVLSGLSYLHDTARICHRDIKPGNLLLSSSGQLKISDFGVSSQLSNSMSKCLSWVGTVTYMSPERIRGDSYGFNTDVWSLGLLLLECAIGRYPYPPETAAGGAGLPRLGFWELLEYIVVEPAPKLPAGQFSVEFADFLGHCLQKDPAKRPSAGLLLQHPFITRGPRTNLSELLHLPQAGGSRSRAAAAGASGSRQAAGVSTGQASGAVCSNTRRVGTEQKPGTVARSSSTRTSTSRANTASGSVAATAVGISRPSSAAVAARLSPYTSTYQSQPMSAGSTASAVVVKVCPTPRRQQQQQQASKQSSLPSSQHGVQQQTIVLQPMACSSGQQQQQQVRQLSPTHVQQQQQARQQSPRLTQQQQARQQSPRLNHQLPRPPGQIAGQQQQSPLRPLSQPVPAAAAVAGGMPSSSGPLTALKPKTTPRKTPVSAGPSIQL